MQFEKFYSLNKCVVAWIPHWNHLGFQPTLANLVKHLWWYQCECVAICPSPQLLKVPKYLIYVCNGCEIQFERFCSLDHRVVASFAYMKHLGFQPIVTNLGNRMWW